MTSSTELPTASVLGSGSPRPTNRVADNQVPGILSHPSVEEAIPHSRSVGATNEPLRVIIENRSHCLSRLGELRAPRRQPKR
jgi:pantoate kinase